LAVLATLVAPRLVWTASEYVGICRESDAPIHHSQVSSTYAGLVTSTSHDPRAWQPPQEHASRPESARLVDPEDDLPSSTYAGDFETTAIPRYDSGVGTPDQQGYALLGDPDPLPYVQPSGRHSAHLVEPAEIEPDVATDGSIRAASRRGTQDIGLMILRVGLGALLIAHGLQKAFGWWGGTGFGGFEQSLAELGFQHARVLSYAGIGAELGAGTLLVLGLFTPLAAAAALAYLLNALLAAVVAQPASGYFPFFLPEGHEYQVTLIVLAAALVLTGPGRYGFDAGRGWARRPFIGSAAALVLGIGVGVAVWVFLNGANPLA
jgi:putative oxidoreductase